MNFRILVERVTKGILTIRIWILKLKIGNSLSQSNQSSLMLVSRFDVASSGEPGVVDKLRWATLGYHHDWDTKVYSEDDRGEFPADLASLSAGIVKALGGDTLYKAEAAIVNYYPANSCLSGETLVTSDQWLRSSLPGHTDHSEINLGAPLVSISLGLPAIFLIGGPSLDTVPSPLLLRWLVMAHEGQMSHVSCQGLEMCWWWSERPDSVTTLCPGSCPERAGQPTQRKQGRALQRRNLLR